MSKTLKEILKEIQENGCFDFSIEETKEFANRAFQAGKDSIREEILNKLPERKIYSSTELDGDTLKKMAYNKALDQVKKNIKKI